MIEPLFHTWTSSCLPQLPTLLFVFSLTSHDQSCIPRALSLRERLSDAIAGVLLESTADKINTGPVVTHQVPANSVVSKPEEGNITGRPGSASYPTDKPLLDFPLLSLYLIPPQSLCNRLLTLRSPTSRHVVISHTICIVDNERYDRNEFIFNFGVVLAEKDSGSAKRLLRAWRGVVKKTATILQILEQDTCWLSEDERAVESGLLLPQESRVYALCEMIMEDLSCYGECMIPVGEWYDPQMHWSCDTVDDLCNVCNAQLDYGWAKIPRPYLADKQRTDEITALSLRLSPKLPGTPVVRPWHVPVLIVDTLSLAIETWDLTLQSLIPFIDGLNHVGRIAQLASADTTMVCEAIQALRQHSCAILLDIFSFSASYAPTPLIQHLAQDLGAREEARNYVLFPGCEEEPVTEEDILRLFCSLTQGAKLRDWVLEASEHLAGVDVRRLVRL